MTAPSPEAPEQGELIPGTVQPVRVTAYRTSDGAVHATRPEAEEREAMLSLKALAVEFDAGSAIAVLGFVDRHSVLLNSILTRLLKAREKQAAPAGDA